MKIVKNIIILPLYLFLFLWIKEQSNSLYSASPETAKKQNNKQSVLKIAKSDIKIEISDIILEGIPKKIEIKFKNPDHPILKKKKNQIEFKINNKTEKVEIKNGIGIFHYTFDDDTEILIQSGAFSWYKKINPIPLWLSILPPLLAILMALIFREVITSLFLGIFIGAAIIGFFTDGISGIFSGFFTVIDTYIINALKDWGHLAVIIFSMVIGGIVSVISKNGGMDGVVSKISKFAKDARSGQLATWFLGIAIFFDDYANTLVVGNTMRPITDKLKISREKLSYIVDSTAAPVAAIAFVTTWIGAELGYIEDGISSVNIIQIKESVYSIFLNSLQYSFYPIFTICFMLFLILKGRDFGPMLKAEQLARNSGNNHSQKGNSTNSTNPGSANPGDTSPNGSVSDKNHGKGKREKWHNAVIPIGVVIFGTIIGLLYTGYSESIWNNESLSFSVKLSKTIGASDSYYALLWASLSGLLIALILTIFGKLMSLSESIDAVMKGFKTMLPAVLILVLSWSLALVTKDLHTADFITGILSNNLSPYLIPALTFILAALVSFSTGSSWGTMAILYPLILPVTLTISYEYGFAYEDIMIIFYNVVSCVLAGSVLGDHCSPISDTTILSSLASSCNHIDHVRTQLPYALTVGIIAVLVGTLPATFDIPILVTYAVGLIFLFLIVTFFGETVKIETP
jgi:Na+/H+ antiporter NhaC